MSTLEEIQKKVKEAKRNIILKAKTAAKNAQQTVSHGAVKVATLLTLASGVSSFALEASAQTGGGYNKGSVELAQRLTAKNSGTGVRFEPVSQREAAMLGGGTTQVRTTTTTTTTTTYRVQQSQSSSYDASYGARASSTSRASGPTMNGVALQFDRVYSHGLKPGYAGAFINPNETPNNGPCFVYYYSVDSHGRYNLASRCTIAQAEDHYTRGVSEYCIAHENGFGGYYPGGGYGAYGDEWDRKMDDINRTMDQVDYAIGTAVRIGETVGDVLETGNAVGGRIKHAINRGKAPSGPRRSPHSR